MGEKKDVKNGRSTQKDSGRGLPLTSTSTLIPKVKPPKKPVKKPDK